MTLLLNIGMLFISVVYTVLFKERHCRVYYEMWILANSLISVLSYISMFRMNMDQERFEVTQVREMYETLIDEERNNLETAFKVLSGSN